MKATVFAGTAVVVFTFMLAGVYFIRTTSRPPGDVAPAATPASVVVEKAAVPPSAITVAAPVADAAVVGRVVVHAPVARAQAHSADAAEAAAVARATLSAQRAQCLLAVVERKLDGDVALNTVRDFGNVRFAPVCARYAVH